MERRVVWLCIGVGSTVGGFLPELWGSGGFGLASILFGAIGGIAGLWLGLRVVA